MLTFLLKLCNVGIMDEYNIIHGRNKDKRFIAENTDNLVDEHESMRKDASFVIGVCNNSMLNEGKLQGKYNHIVDEENVCQAIINDTKKLPPSDYSHWKEMSCPQRGNFESQTNIHLHKESKSNEFNVLGRSMALESRPETFTHDGIEKSDTKICNSNSRSDIKMTSSEAGNIAMQINVSSENTLGETNVNAQNMKISTHFKKSRKQNLSKRLAKEQILGDIDYAMHNSCNAIKSESEHPIKNTSKKIENELNINASENTSRNLTNKLENGILVRHIKLKNEPGLIETSDEWNAHDTLADNHLEPEYKINENVDVNFDKFCLFSPYKHMTSLDLLANMSQDLLQTPDNIGATSTSYLDDFDMVRHMRGIRCSRYRKISTAEKKKITAYAKLHGVSQAAVCYNVSKSAVSMWNRIDLNQLEDLCEKKKRNRMWGNEKFESLLIKVKNEKNNKFRGLTKQDKFEVSRYAKIVGVREMARCLDVALGTVSGWMRQFPYKVSPEGHVAENCTDSDIDNQAKSDSEQELINAEIKFENNIVNQERNSPQDAYYSEQNESEISNTGMNSENYGSYVEKNSETETSSENNEANTKCHDFNSNINSETDSKIIESVSAVIQCNKKPTEKNDKSNFGKEEDVGDFETVVKDGQLFIVKTTPPSMKRRASDSDLNDRQNKRQFGMDMAETPEINECSKKDEVDEMIAEMQKMPNVETCFSNVQHLISGTPLERDDFFKELFDRVIACRHDKYKSLKASEKLEVVRYSRRIGVRRVARILGLATGTLSGWNNKYRSHLCLTDQNMSQCSDLNSSTLSSDLDQSRQETNGSLVSKQVQLSNPHMSPCFPRPSSVLDNEEKSEVTAVKFLLKEKYPVFLKKIEDAKKMKFKNVSHEEKIEIVKCTKLVGIRPTARVLNMPIGTLSGWISKYSNRLHPAYHENPEVILPDIKFNGQQLESTAISYYHSLIGANLDLFPFGRMHSVLPSSSVEMETRSSHAFIGNADSPEMSSYTYEHESYTNTNTQNQVNYEKTIVNNMLSKVKQCEYAKSEDSTDRDSEKKDFVEEASLLAQQFWETACQPFALSNI